MKLLPTAALFLCVLGLVLLSAFSWGSSRNAGDRGINSRTNFRIQAIGTGVLAAALFWRAVLNLVRVVAGDQ